MAKMDLNRLHRSLGDQLLDGTLPAVDPADLNSAWAMLDDLEARYPGQQVGISINQWVSGQSRSGSPRGHLANKLDADGEERECI
jgi:hypothetical protein